jgi:hypothetical protein
MSDQPDIDIYVPLLPEICPECGRELLVKIKQESEMYRIAQFCPHNDVLMHAELGKHEGKRAVLRWAALGPISEPEALEQIAEMAERHGAELHVLVDPEQLN